MKKQTFYRRIKGEKEEKWDPVEGYRVIFPDIPGAFFCYKENRRWWYVCEISTGLAIVDGVVQRTRKKSIENAHNFLLTKLDIFQERIEYWVKKNGLPPYPVE